MTAEILKTLVIRELNDILILGGVVILRAVLAFELKQEEKEEREEDKEEQHTIALRGLDMDSDYLLRISDEDYHMTERIVGGSTLAAGYAFELKRPRSSLAVEYIRQ